MERPPKKEINKEIDKNFKEIIKTWQPEFGNEDDIIINSNLQRLEKKSLNVDTVDNLKSEIIYILKHRDCQQGGLTNGK
jgi:uncharacterized protein YihD (DUF1040 family)